MLDSENLKVTTVGLSLILATLGRAQELSRFFDSIAASARMPLEVIVVDQNSDDRLISIIEMAIKQGISVNHIRTSRKGLSYARNAGLREARYEIVGFPDDDCWYEPHCCEAVCAEFDSDLNLAGLVARWSDRHGKTIQPVMLEYSLQRRFSGIPMASICLFLRAQLVRDAGGFDEQLGVGAWYGSSEETDLMLTILCAGHRVSFCPEIAVRHFWSGAAIEITGSISEIFSNAKKRARGTGAIYAKHSIPRWIILKGLLVPLLKATSLRGGMRGLAYFSGLLFGRIQGFVNWNFRQKHL